jgi:nitrate reductase NapAB chaperone NapD
MHNYDEIEKIYYKRKRKKYILTISSIIVIAGIIYLLKYYINIFKNSNSKTAIKKEKIENKNINNKINQKNKLILNSQIPKITIKKEPKIVEEKNHKTISQKQKIKNTKITKKEKLKIVVVQKSQKLTDLLNYYKSFKDYDTAIEIANIYYKNKDYHNSITWAKKANDLNAKDVKSWLIYAKSLVGLNKKIKAKTLLKLYLEIYGPNKKISSYLRSIK